MLFKHCEPFWNLLINVKIDNILASKIQVEKLEAISKCQGQPGCRLDLAARCRGSSLPPGVASPGWWPSRGSCCTDQCCLLSHRSLTPQTGWRSHSKPAPKDRWKCNFEFDTFSFESCWRESWRLASHSEHCRFCSSGAKQLLPQVQFAWYVLYKQ